MAGRAYCVVRIAYYGLRTTDYGTWMACWLLAACALVGCEGRLELDVVKPRKGAIRESFSEPARTRLANVYPIAMPVAGRIERITLEPGDTVKKGQALVKYDLVPFTEAVAEAKGSVGQYEAEITLKNDNRLEETTMHQTRATVVSSEEALKASDEQVAAQQVHAEHMQRAMERVKKSAPFEAASQLDEAQTKANTANIELKREAFYRAAMKAMHVAVQLGPVFIEKYIQRKSLERDVLVHQLAQAKSKLARAEHDLKLADIRSPIDGVVLERVEQGDRSLSAGQLLLRLGNLDELEVVADVLTQDALRIGVGSEVSLEPAMGLEPAPGKVKRIEPQGFTKQSSLGVEQQRVNVIVELAGKRDGLGVGYRMQARFFTGSKPDALIVPRFSVLQAPDRSFYVFKHVGGKLKKQPVVIGLRSDLELEVTQGLSAEDVIVAAPDTTMKDGMKVSVRAR